ncbi:peroxiredoxin [Candidatus Woesebacteria bacterium]|nr:peroxiredoxin [Candidatus Woesebacteria bacterium]
MKAPNFELLDQDNVIHTLSDYAGSWLLVYFYPKDDTPGCTKEACAFRDMSSEFAKRGIKVVGISKDTVTSHRKFADKFELPFTLLSDPEKTTIQAYNAWGERKSFLIDPQGNIVKEYPKVTPDQHAEEILTDFDALQ